MIRSCRITLIAFCLFFSSLVAAEQETWVDPVTGMTFIAIPKGCFQMGSKVDNLSGFNDGLKPYYQTITSDERPQHEVCLDAFWLAQFEVRASDWEKVLRSPAPKGSGSAPVGNISYQQAQQFAQHLTELSQGQSRFRLPTEAEWEYACRANSQDDVSPFHGNKTEFAWYSTKSQMTLQPKAVGQLKPNAWGLYDMLGNVWEWVEDSYQQQGYQQHSLYNPLIKTTQTDERVIRGASHRSDYVQIRCGNRSSYPADERLTQIGLRLVRQPMGAK